MPSAWRCCPWPGVLPLGCVSPCLIMSQIVSSSGWSMQVVSVIADHGSLHPPRQPPRRLCPPGSQRRPGHAAGRFAGRHCCPAPSPASSAPAPISPSPMPTPCGSVCFVGCLNLIPMWLLTSAARAGPDPHRPRAFPRRVAPAAAGSLRICHQRRSCLVQDLLISLHGCGASTPHRLSQIEAVTSVGMLVAIVAALSSTQLARRRSSGQMMLMATGGIAGSLLLMFVIPHWLGAAAGVVGVFGILGIWRPRVSGVADGGGCPSRMAPLSYRAPAPMGMSLGFGSMSLRRWAHRHGSRLSIGLSRRRLGGPGERGTLGAPGAPHGPSGQPGLGRRRELDYGHCRRARATRPLETSGARISNGPPSPIPHTKAVSSESNV